MLSIILNFIFHFSNSYIRLSTLLVANKAQQENLAINIGTLGIGFRNIRFFVLFFALYHIALTPPMYMYHNVLKSQNCHIAILIAMIYMLVFFVLYATCKQYAFKVAIMHQIKYFWKIHFSYFNYNDYAKVINDIYNNSIKEHIAKDKLERYVFDSISKLK